MKEYPFFTITLLLFALLSRTSSLPSAIRRGDLSSVLQHIQSEINFGSDSGQLPPLHLAAVGGHQSIVQELIDAGAPVNGIEPHYQNTPLHYAATAQVVQILCLHGADLEAHNKDGLTPLHWTAGRPYTEYVQELIQAGAQPHARDKRGQIPLHKVGAHDNVNIARALIQAGSEINIEDTNGHTPLYSAIIFKTLKGEPASKIIPMLLGLGASVPDIDTFYSWAWHVQQALLARKRGTRSELPVHLVQLIGEFTTNATPKAPEGIFGWLAYYCEH